MWRRVRSDGSTAGGIHRADDDAADRMPATTRNPFGLRFTLPLMLGTTLNPINSSLIATGLSGIAADFGVSPGKAATLVSVLYLCSAVGQPTMGKLSTLVGARRVFLTGTAILLVGGAVGGAAQDFPMLLLSRALIGVGTSAAYPTAMAMVRQRAGRLSTSVPSRVLGDFTIASQVTVVFGLPIGGVLAGAFGWRGLFWINVPLALIALVSVALVIETDDVASSSARSVLGRVDLVGIAIFATTIVSLLLFLQDLSSPRWWLLTASTGAALCLVLWERRTASPLIDVRMLASNGRLRRTYLRQLLVGLGVYTSLYANTQWMADVAGYSAYTVGLIMLPMSAVSIVCARMASSRGLVRWPLVVGAGALVIAALLMFAIRSGTHVAVLALVPALFGVTNGLSNFANQSTLYAQAPADALAVAAGLFRTFGYIGAIFSASLISLTFGHQASDSGLHRLAFATLGIGVIAFAQVVFDRSIPRRAGEEPSAR